MVTVARWNLTNTFVVDFSKPVLWPGLNAELFDLKSDLNGPQISMKKLPFVQLLRQKMGEIQLRKIDP